MLKIYTENIVERRRNCLSTIFYYLMLDFYVKKRTRISLPGKRLFEIIKDEITRVDCIINKKKPYFELYRLSSVLRQMKVIIR